MQRNKKDDDFWWWLILLIIVASSSDAQSKPTRPDTSTAAVHAIIARADSAAGRPGGRSKHRYSHTISEMQAPWIKTTTEVWTMEPNRVLTRTTTEGAGTMEIGYNGSVGWTNSPLTGPVLLEGEPLKALAKLSDRSQLLASLKNLSAGPRTVVEGRDVVSVSFQNSEGIGGTLYFDIRTGLLHATRAGDSAKPDSMMLSVASDYKRIDGELFAMTSTMKVAGQSIVTRTTHVDHEPIDTSLFNPPAAVRAPLKRP